MQFYGALVLFVTLGAALGLRCYVCNRQQKCGDTMTCPAGFDRCAVHNHGGDTTRSCLNHEKCLKTIKCCDTDLCNSALPNGPSSVLLLLVTSAIITLFL